MAGGRGAMWAKMEERRQSSSQVARQCPSSGPAQGRPQGPFSCVGAAGATECNGDGDFYVFYVCFAHDKMSQSLRSGSLGASWELPQPDLLCHSLKGA